MMRAYTAAGAGLTGQLTEITVPLPIPGEHEVLIESYAISVHPGIGQTRSGIAGVVAAAGSGVGRFKPGDAVFGLMSAEEGGTYTEYMLASGHELALKPEGLSFEAAGILPAAGLAAWQALAWAQVSGRDRVLIHDGTGGTGSFAVQLAKLRGATVITTISGNGLDLAWELGADQAICSGEQDFTAILGRSIDVVIDTGGGAALDRSFAVLAPGGKLVSTAGTPDPRKAAQQGVNAAYIVPAADPFQLTELARLAAGRRLKPLIGGIFPFSADGLRGAQDYSESRQMHGIHVIQFKSQE
ncbi:NADP-dependent oxidoreductase [Paenibacillus sp. MMS20-IR301]|uniref:NADP-dependent oxidoreductase n=1 Tax=Paenibacillus sp. MMS20-IR301 TaxID=2895946 RepID=UPI0028E327CE|nr:NADP-dependent oxidoreductase [Paenibacillus sp. MMS20-IR301]WNS41441.1 NADP-dependent oxidoreductase [Paenibacillus sp. MMS20-IR301]